MAVDEASSDDDDDDSGDFFSDVGDEIKMMMTTGLMINLTHNGIA